MVPMTKSFYIIAFLICLQSCATKLEQGRDVVISISGEIAPEEMGRTLVHEHMLVDFIGADSTGFHRWDREEVVEFLTPHIRKVQEKGVKTIVECTPSFLGKDPILLQLLSERTGMQFITNTGYYGAVSGKYLPGEINELSSEELAKRWVDEFKNGIEGTGVRPGFIKIGVNEGELLSANDQRLVQAAALTHKETGLLVVSHTGTWKTAKAQVAILKKAGINLNNFVWVHAQNEPDFENYREAVKEGVWVSLDGIVWDVEGHLQRLKFFKEQLGLDRVLISHDAGWYTPGEADQSGFKGYTSLFDELMPKLLDAGFNQDDIDKLLINNPREAFAVRVD